LRRLQQELAATSINVELWTDEGRTWKEKSERMLKSSFQHYIAKREALERTFDRAKVFYMTVDGFVQAASGLSSLSAYVSSFEYVLVNVDEAHQLVYDQLASVAARSKKLNLCMDEGQHVAYDRQSNKMGVGAELDSNTYYSWERAVHGGSSLPAWHSLQVTVSFAETFPIPEKGPGKGSGSRSILGSD